MHSAVLLALVAAVAANPVSYTGASIPSCGWTTTLITEAGATDTVPIPLASADCSGESTPTAPATVVAPTTTVAPPPPVVSPTMTMQCSEYQDGQPQCSMAPVSPCTEYKDGQPQCGSSAAATTPAPVCTEYKDGQPQCGSSASPSPSPCTEYKDGQPQCGSSASGTGYYPTGGYGTGAAPSGTGALPSTSYGPVATGAAMVNGPAVGLLAAAGFAVAML